jgi:HK97 family phage major capsid protein
MTKKSQELRKQAEGLYRNIKDLYTKKETTQEDDQKFEQWNKEYDELIARANQFEAFELKEIQESEQVREAETQFTKGDVKPEDKKKFEALAMKEYLLTGTVSPQLRAYMAPAKKENDDNKMIDAEYKRLGLVRAAQQSTTDGSGGYTIPQGFSNELEIAMKAYGGMLQASRIWRTASGNVVDWPKVNDTSNRGYLLSEATSAETSAVKLTDANQQFEAYKLTSGLLRISSELIQDSAFNIVQVVNDFLAERLGRAVNYYTTVGDGSSKPKGITIGAAHGNNTADDQTLAIADFLALEHEVDPAYRVGASWMFHDSVLKEIKRVSLAATVGYPLWVPDFTSNSPGTILGHPYFVNQDMATFTQGSASANDNAKIALFGNFQKYVIRFAGETRMVRLNERYGDTDEIGLVAFLRIDGDLLDAGTHPVKYMRVSAT